MKKRSTKQAPKAAQRLRVFDLYLNGDKIGTALYKNEVAELKREYKQLYAERGYPCALRFEVVEV